MVLINKVSIKKLYFLPTVILSLILLTILIQLLKKQGYGLTYPIHYSMPKGLYAISPAKHLHYGDIVIFKAPSFIQDFMIKHHWTSQNGQLMKYVIGMPNDFACQKDKKLWINNQVVAVIHQEYLPGKKIPTLAFCRQLSKNEFLLISTQSDRSYDSRYFGPISSSAIIGKATRIL